VRLNLLAVEAALESLREIAEHPHGASDAERLAFGAEWHDALVRLREIERAQLEGQFRSTEAEMLSRLRRELERAAPLVQTLDLEPVPTRLPSVV